jgi:hypothetical protein
VTIEDRSGIEELETRFRTLAPRCELIARMALRQQYPQFIYRHYFTRIAFLIKKLDLSPEDLNKLRADAEKVVLSPKKASTDQEVA